MRGRRLNKALVEKRKSSVQQRVKDVIRDDTGMSIYNYHAKPFLAFRVYLVDPQDVRLVRACGRTLCLEVC